ncbi:P-loop containing nucleoside triphosphate hydrolase protein [Neohortaea acidophila]|uniref:RNA helicase n=1 Tax=Neohortaea acidophila TaxID=245834 RepID=A0A6A6PPM2_9PEZI|nr:P-loop containing nucleoside triphosphate hydrolase protein [Neohortaea acidophila]KAF2481746.1 P-loop containing nucleoside triphosphate hydrolase protein [Neohortaea acidophila]
MFRLSSSLCPFCAARALAPPTSTPWQASRNAATLQKRKPSRMVLSPSVKRGPVKPSSSGRPAQRSRNSPWGGLNMTVVPRDLHSTKNQLPAAEQRRSNRFSKDAGKPAKTKEPMKALKMQQRLTNVSYERRGRVKEAILQRTSFDEFDLLPVIKDSIATQALGGMVDVSPTPVQRLAIPALLDSEGPRNPKFRRKEQGGKKEMREFLLAAETGSGKTLAYVLPVIDAIKRAEFAEQVRDSQEMDESRATRPRNKLFDIDPPTDGQPDPSTGRPRAIILVPTAELVEQVGHLVKSFAHTVKYRSTSISADYTGRMIRSRLFSAAGIDIVVSTPHLLSSITESEPNILSRVTHLVIDEADSLLDRSFSPITSSIIDRATPSLQQLILCSATIPRSLDSYLHKRFPNIRRLVTPNLHAIPRRVQLSVVDIDKIPYQGNRDLACAQVIWDIGKEVAEEGEEREKKVLVFVNEREKTTELAEYLQKKGIEAVALSRDSAERKNNDMLASFTSATTAPSTTSTKNLLSSTATSTFHPAISPADLADSSTEPSIPAGRTLPNTKVLITTDISSRGIDTLPLRHVLLYDVPHTSIDFIHRLGRVGRMNRRGRGIVLVGKKDRKDVVREVRDGMFKGAALI